LHAPGAHWQLAAQVSVSMPQLPHGIVRCCPGEHAPHGAKSGIATVRSGRASASPLLATPAIVAPSLSGRDGSLYSSAAAFNMMPGCFLGMYPAA